MNYLKCFSTTKTVSGEKVYKINCRLLLDGKIQFLLLLVLDKTNITKVIITTAFVTVTQPTRVILEHHLSY